MDAVGFQSQGPGYQSALSAGQAWGTMSNTDILNEAGQAEAVGRWDRAAEFYESKLVSEVAPAELNWLQLPLLGTSICGHSSAMLPYKADREGFVWQVLLCSSIGKT